MFRHADKLQALVDRLGPLYRDVCGVWGVLFGVDRSAAQPVPAHVNIIASPFLKEGEAYILNDIDLARASPDEFHRHIMKRLEELGPAPTLRVAAPKPEPRRDRRR